MEIVIILILIFIFEQIKWDMQAVLFFGAIIFLFVVLNMLPKNIDSEKSDAILGITFACIFFLTSFVCFSKHIIMAIISFLIASLFTIGIKSEIKNKACKLSNKIKNRTKVKCENIQNNTITLLNPKIMGYGYVFYDLIMKYEYENKQKFHKIENVKQNNFWIYKKNGNSFECILSSDDIIEQQENQYEIIIDTNIDDYYLFFEIAREINPRDEGILPKFINYKTGQNYITDFLIVNNKTGYVYAENLERIIYTNDNLEFLYCTHNTAQKDISSLYLWKPKTGKVCLSEDFRYGLYYDFSNRNFYKTIKYPFREDNFINIYFYKKDCNSYYILMELAQTADDFEILPNKFEDDTETVNYRVRFNKKRLDDIALFYYSMDRIATYCTNQSAANYGLFYNKSVLDTCGGTAIYNVPFIDYFKGLEGEFKVFNIISQFQLQKEQKDYFKKLVCNIYTKYDMPVDYDKLPDEFIKDCICEDLQYTNLKEFLEKQYTKTHEIYNFKTFPDVLKEKCQDKYNLVKQDLIARKVIKSKWKSELDLFRLVHKHYPSAIYQYHADWLGLQSLDIYIPDLRIGIEYQGEQHYRVVDFFGGEESFHKRQELDERKRKLCIENNVKLIEWKYDEAITQINLDNKINELITIQR